MKVIEFTGGLNTKIDPSLLPGNIAVQLVNADLASGVLKAMNNVADTASYTGVLSNFIQHKGNIVSSNDADVGYTEYANDLYFMKSSILTQLRNGVEYTVGIVKPTSAPVVGLSNQPTAPTSVLTSIGASDGSIISYITGTGDLTGLDSSYRYIYKNDSGVEYRTNDFTIQNGVPTPYDSLTHTPSGGDDTFTLDIYRLYLGVYRLVGTTSLGSLIVPITDQVLDISANVATITSLPSGGLAPSTQYNYEVFEYNIVNSVKVYSLPLSISVTTGVSDENVEITVTDISRTEVYRVYVDPSTLSESRHLVPYYSDTGAYIDYLAVPTYAVFATTGGVNGTYQYVYTFYNSITGYESVPSEPSLEIVLVNGVVRVSNLGTATSATHIKIYRVGGTLTVFTLVTTVVIGTLTYDDSLSDVEIPGTLLISNDYDYPPPLLTLLTESNGVLLGAIGSRLRYSKQGLLFAWPAENFIDFKSPITCIAEVANGIVVATSTKTFIITGNTPAAYSKYVVSGEQGCQYAASYQKLKNGVILKSTTALMFTGGGVPELLSEKFFNPLSIFIKASTVHNNTYYAVGNSDIFVYDLTENNYYTIGITCDNIGVVDDNVHVLIGGSLFRLFTGTGQLTLQYKSPVFTEGSHSETKIYNNIYLAMNGNFTIKVYLDEVLRLTKVYTTTAIEIQDIKLPQKYQRAKSLQIEITGTGIVYEYEYKTTGRQNGK